MPVLIPVANPKPTPCDDGQRFVAVLNWHFGEDRTTQPCRLRRGATRDPPDDIGRVMECDR